MIQEERDRRSDRDAAIKDYVTSGQTALKALVAA